MIRTPEDPISEWRPKKDFYLSNSRSAEIRSMCLITIQALERLMSDADVAHNPLIKVDLYTQIEIQNGKLIGLGIRTGMHVCKGAKVEDFEADPIMSAEFLAGQLFRLMGIKVSSETELYNISQEHNELEEKSFVLFDPNMISAKGRDYLVYRSVLNHITTKFDIGDEEFDIQENASAD